MDDSDDTQIQPEIHDDSMIPYRGYTFRQKLTRFVIGFFGFFIVLALLVGGFMSLSKHFTASPPTQKNKTIAKQTTVAPPSSLPVVTAPPDWNIFANADHTYSIVFPTDYIVVCSSQYSCAISKTADTSSSVYISTVTQDMKDSKGEIENYDPDEAKILSSLKITETKTTRKNADTPEVDQYYSFTRLPNETVAGKTAFVFENPKPQDKPDGTTERRYLVTDKNMLYIFGAYLSKDGITLQQFRQMLSGVELF